MARTQRLLRTGAAAATMAALAAVSLAACASSGSATSKSTSGTSSSSSSATSSAGGGASAVASTSWSKAQSLAQGGGMASLVAAAKKEGTLNVITLPRTWAGYGAILDAFHAKYGITINSENPNGSSGDEINAVKSTKGQASAPDVLDIGNSYALSASQDGLLAPYKVATWSDIPDAQKDSGGLWFADYGGYISIGCNAKKVTTCPTTIKALDNPAYKGLVALNGDPTEANAAFEAVWAAALANGGSATNIQPGIDFFHKLNSQGIFNKTKVTPATIASGETPIVMDWDYLNVGNTASYAKQGIQWKTAVPTDGLVSSYYDQAISINAAHPAAARLWEEFLYSHSSDGGQNGWLRGAARPIELNSIVQDKTVDTKAVSALPKLNDPKPFTPTADQITAAKNVVTQKWSAAVS